MERKVSRRKALGSIIAGAGLFAAGSAEAIAFEDQPRMRSALDHLRAALSDLQAATSDKGGHRAAAINHTRQAIQQVERGIAFDNRRPRR